MNFVMSLALPFLLAIFWQAAAQDFACGSDCSIQIVETIPEGMSASPHKSTYQAWIELIESANSSIEIASYYWTLRDHETTNPPHPTSNLGEDVLEKLKAKARLGTVPVRIAKELNSNTFPNHDIAELLDAGAEVRDVNFTRLLGAGILHTKMWIVDRKHFYLGSANLDWRALTQVKEVGVYVQNCSCLGEDIGKTFDVYWHLGQNGTEIPEPWPENFTSPYNSFNPSLVQSGGISYETFVSSAPPQFCPSGRTTDLSAIVGLIESAENFVYIALMDYFPLIMFDGPLRFWGELDDKLKEAAMRGVKVRLLTAKWSNTRNSAKNFLSSLQSLNGSYPNVNLEVRLFQVPADEDQTKIPFARVNHNKFVVTEKATHIGTSNWSGDYFVSSGGVGFVAKPMNNSDPRNIRAQMEDIFLRDWNSDYALSIQEAFSEGGPGQCNSASNTQSFKNAILSTIFIFVKQVSSRYFL